MKSREIILFGVWLATAFCWQIQVKQNKKLKLNVLSLQYEIEIRDAVNKRNIQINDSLKNVGQTYKPKQK